MSDKTNKICLSVEIDRYVHWLQQRPLDVCRKAFMFCLRPIDHPLIFQTTEHCPVKGTSEVCS